MVTVWCGPRLFKKRCSRGPRRARLTAITGGSATCALGYVCARAVPSHADGTRRHCGPRNRCRRPTGTWMTPSTGLPAFISAILTVNSPLPRMNSRVPSNGSISQYHAQRRRSSSAAGSPSSETTGTFGRECVESGADCIVGGHVGVGDRRAVGLLAHAVVPLIDLQDVVPGVLRQRDCTLQQGRWIDVSRLAHVPVGPVPGTTRRYCALR